MGGACSHCLRQDYKKKIEEVFGSDGSRLVQMKPSQFNSHYSKLFEPMKERLGRTTGPALLKDYSPWLHDFQAGDRTSRLEVPGQYHGRAKPLPEYHAHISSCDKKVGPPCLYATPTATSTATPLSQVLVLDSMRKPKRLTLCGDDEREYIFLVKGGEDLRLDQRIEQVWFPFLLAAVLFHGMCVGVGRLQLMNEPALLLCSCLS